MKLQFQREQLIGGTIVWTTTRDGEFVPGSLSHTEQGGHETFKTIVNLTRNPAPPVIIETIEI